MDSIMRQMLLKIQECVDALHPSNSQLIVAKKTSKASLGELTSLCTRIKIYKGCHAVIRKYKQGEDMSQELDLLLKRVSIHRNQLFKLAKEGKPVDLTNFKYLQGLRNVMRLFRKVDPAPLD